MVLFPNFNIKNVIFPKTTQVRQEFWVQKVVNLFVYNPLINFWQMWKDINRSIVFLIEAIILFKKELRLRTHVYQGISVS